MQKKHIIPALILGLFVVGIPSVLADTYDNKRELRSDEYEYGATAFSEEYSRGYLTFNTNRNVGSGVSRTENGSTKSPAFDESTPVYYAKNTSKDLNTYVDTYDGASYNGESYDLREYFWTDADSEWVTPVSRDYSISAHNENEETTNVYIELHFYKAGTLATDSPEEVEFKGVIEFSDNDKDEGFQFQNGLNAVYLSNPTILARSEDSENTWIGTASNEDDPKSAIHAELHGTPESPILIRYIRPNSLGANLGTSTKTVSYAFLSAPDGVSTPATVTVNTYGTYSLENPIVTDGTAVENYTFSGWYTDVALTIPASSTLSSIDSDTIVYGKYTLTTADVTTSVTNGTITESGTGLGIGTDYTVTYSANEGYKLKSVLIDGVAVDTSTYGESYTFSNLQGDHEIIVTYEAETEDTTTTTSDNTISAPDTGAQAEKVNKDGGNTALKSIFSLVAILASIGIVKVLIGKCLDKGSKFFSKH